MGTEVTGDDARVARAFCVWLRQEGLAICRDVGASRWGPIPERDGLVVRAFLDYLTKAREEEEQEQEGSDDG